MIIVFAIIAALIFNGCAQSPEDREQVCRDKVKSGEILPEQLTDCTEGLI